MGRLSNDEKAKRAREVLVNTLCKIVDLEPTLGGKWRAGMVAYYKNRLIELVLYQSGFPNASPEARHAVSLEIDDLLRDI